MDEFKDLLSNFGFPVVIAGYLLIRMEQRMRDMEATIQKLILELQRLTDFLREKNHG